ncbi:MAG: dUTP diphosphatase [Lachnospiraceae bacterium]|nr:dUTP diphosphatase [Lachnospiraceae bacterium]
MVVNYVKLTEAAHEPTRGSLYAAGLDLYASEVASIYPGETAKVHTGIAIELPAETFGAIYARSGIATKQGLRPANCVGVIDADYRGEIIVALHNDSNQTRVINPGERIAQLVVQPYLTAVLNEVDHLSETVRGSGGFGSTGESFSQSDTYNIEYATYDVQYEQMTFADLPDDKPSDR